jgi:predicted ester cyclase
MSTEENKATLQRVGEIFIKGDLSLVPELIAPNYVYHGSGGQEVKGLEGFKQMVTMFRTAFPDLHGSIEYMIAEGDMLAVRLIFTGTHKGEFMGIAPTGKKVTITDHAFMRFEGGKEVEVWGILDMLSIYQQLGVVPPMGQGGG